MPKFQNDELVVFIGHSDDASEEAQVLRQLEPAFLKELRSKVEVLPQPPFKSVKVWEWSEDAGGEVGGQNTLIDPVVDSAHIAIFVFKERVGTVTQDEVERCRTPSENNPPVYAVFPKAPDPEKLNDEDAARRWLDLLSYKRRLGEQWTGPDSRAVRPLKDYAGHSDLTKIVLEQFRRDLGGVVKRKIEHLGVQGTWRGSARRDRESARFEGQHPQDDFLSRVEAICQLRAVEGATIKRLRFSDPAIRYLRISTSQRGIHQVYPVGAVRDEVTPEALEAFLTVHRDYQGTDSGVVSTLVYGGPPAREALVRQAARDRVELRSFVEYQGLLDFRPYVEQQTQRLQDDPLYPPSLYVPQRLRFFSGENPKEAEALTQVEEWLTDPYGRFVLVLGHFGTGKTFLLHELARRLGEAGGPLTPILIEMRDLEKGRSLDELVAQHLARAGMERIDLKAFRYMLAQGRIVLLFDGFDELALRVSYDRAGEHFATLVEAAGGEAKVVVTSRTTHFESDRQVKTALGEKVEMLSGRRVAHLRRFDESQIRSFLINRLGDEAAAAARFEIIDQVKDLLGLAHNPRMLSFIADLGKEDLLAAKAKEGEITSAELYRLILERWLLFEYRRQQPKGAPPALSVDERWDAATQLALRLWQRTERTLTVSEMSDELAAALENLVSGLSRGVATHQVGSGTLLVRDAEGGFSFIHQSVLEWLVARRAAQELEASGSSEVLAVRELSPLMADFVIGLAGRQRAATWASVQIFGGVGGVRGISEVAKKNALVLTGRLDEATDKPPDDAALTVPETVADLSDQDLRGQDLSGRNLRGAVLSLADLTSARLVGADLRSAQLDGAILKRADLSRARLAGADLSHADLTAARLLGTDLSRAHLEGCVLRRTALVGATVGAFDGDFEGSAPPVPREVLPWVARASPYHAVAWDPRGELLASGHDDGSVSVWDVAAGEEVYRFLGHRNSVWSIAFSPDGKSLASGSSDKTVRLWQTSSGKHIRTLQGHQNSVWSIAFSPDGKSLASGSYDKTVRLWQTSSGKHIRTLQGHQNYVLSIAFSPDGKSLASGSYDKTVRLWQTSSGKHIRTLQGHQNYVLSIAFSPDGKSLASGSYDKTVRLWQTSSGKHIRTLQGHQNYVLSIAFSPDGKSLASGSEDKTVRLWQTSSGKHIRTLQGHQNSVWSIAFSPDGKSLASGSDDKTVRLWQTSSGKHIRTLQGHQNSVLSIAFSPDGKSLASGSYDKTVRLWQTSSGKHIRTLQGHQNYVLSIAFSPDGKSLASGSEDKTVRLWQTSSGKHIRTLQGHQNSVWSIAFSPDGKSLASGSYDKTVRLWQTSSGKHIRTLQGHQNSVWSIAFSPDGKSLASGSDDKTVRLWQTSSGKHIRTLQGHQNYVLSIAFSPDGKSLASGSYDNTVRLWQTSSGKHIRTLQGHQNYVLSIAFSPDGKSLASGSDDKTVRLWQTSSGKHIRTLQGHQNSVWSIAFSPDGKSLASGSYDNTVRLWNLTTGRCFAILASLSEGWVAYTPEGRYKFGGEIAGGFWHSVNLCRFAPGELDPYLPESLRLADDEPFLPDSAVAAAE